MAIMSSHIAKDLSLHRISAKLVWNRRDFAIFDCGDDDCGRDFRSSERRRRMRNRAGTASPDSLEICNEEEEEEEEKAGYT